MRIGALYSGEGRCEFIVWAPHLDNVELRIVSPGKRNIPMEKDDRGYWKTVADGIHPGTRYFYMLDRNKLRPDPASFFQPEGVHGPSEVIDHGVFGWEDDKWSGIPLGKMTMYELHVGTFTPEGAFDSIIPRIDELLDTGINAIEIMPVAQFPGERNWGYDGVYPYAVQDSYGGHQQLKRLVNECHKKGMAVILDVVYNHLGPEGNYLWDFGPYFTDKYRTPWGSAINFDSAYSDDVRNFFIENAIYWFKNYHIDALRLDAIHGITDMSAKHFLEELAERCEEFSSKNKRKYYLIAESDLNDSRVIRPRNAGGYGIDAQWNDDFHHSLRTIITGEKTGYYMDFGEVGDLARAIKEGFVYSWRYSAYRKRRHGNSSEDIPGYQFVVCSQNHDQVGNRMLGERLPSLVSFESLKLAAGAVIFSPYIPLLFMGEEYGEDSPFLYFISHSDLDLIEAVRKGRKEEFRAFAWQGEAPDPYSRDTFLKSRIDWSKRDRGGHRILLDFYRALFKSRRETPALSNLDKECMEVYELTGEKVIAIMRWDRSGSSKVLCILNFNMNDTDVTLPMLKGRWIKMMDSSENVWNGPGTLLGDTIDKSGLMTLRGQSIALYRQEGNS
ncbi:MAG: malto-oligosyltrehalose trehalohydrolase [Nitrospirota bacterium]